MSARAVERELTITNRLGLHARAASLIVQALAGHEATVTLAKGATEVNAKSIFDLLMLEAVQGTVLRLRAEGPDAEAAVAAVVALAERRFDEDEEG